MTDLTYMFTAVAILAGVMAGISIWSRRRLWIRFAALAVAALLLPLSYAAFAQLLSQPKPISLEWWFRQADEATVLGSSIQEGEGIYLWLQFSTLDEPRAYRLPWDRELAEQLQAALREAEENHSQLRMRGPFEPSLDDRDPKFYALPQPALPPKDAIDPPVHVPEQDA